MPNQVPTVNGVIDRQQRCSVTDHYRDTPSQSTFLPWLYLPLSISLLPLGSLLLFLTSLSLLSLPTLGYGE
ncbi:uncharacterized protein G2W53_002537 [Senna tora]|uniref:Uncharacterized protein n=1 Tax=Senna tora TaxID=362788 RepID=A0A835CFH0_9FABA|nr:uncharacterized protein G2W53_002537 [Senna tora]